MATSAKSSAKSRNPDLLTALTQQAFLFRGMERDRLAPYFPDETLETETLYSNRPVYTAFRSDSYLDRLYVILSGGPVIIRSTPLDRIITISYPGGCFGMRNLPIGYGQLGFAFASQVEAYKTTHVLKLPLAGLQQLYQDDADFRSRYDHLFELREKFQYHLLNCSTYPPQAVAALLRALVYQERSLTSQPDAKGIYSFDLPIDIIARACQLNHRTVEQVLKGMQKVGLIEAAKDGSEDILRVLDAEALKETYSATRDKVPWWPLK